MHRHATAMRPNIEAVTAQIVAVRAKLQQAPVPLQEVEDALCDGYTLALTVDAWLTERTERLEEMLDDTAVRGRDLREIASDNAHVRRSVAELRSELESLRRERDRLQDHMQPAAD